MNTNSRWGCGGVKMLKEDNIRKEKNSYEKKAEEWFKENGYDYRYYRQYNHLTVFEVEKDGRYLGKAKVYYEAGTKKSLEAKVKMLLENKLSQEKFQHLHC